MGQPFATVARLESRDTSKPLSRTRVDATVATRYFGFYANTIESYYGDTIPVLEDKFGSWRQPESWT
jgi:aldehyde dehydrogenase (NAD+)